jgi:hypothetical protein
MSVEHLAERELAGKTEVFGQNLPPLLLCPPQIPHHLTWDRTQASPAGTRRLTA